MSQPTRTDETSFGVVSRLSRFRERIRALPGGWVAWRVGITFVGVAVIIVGIILLPLPGPGWLIIFAGMGLLATEYAWAARLLTWARRLVESWTRWALAQPLIIRLLIGLAGLVLLAAIIFAGWYTYLHT